MFWPTTSVVLVSVTSCPRKLIRSLYFCSPVSGPVVDAERKEELRAPKAARGRAGEGREGLRCDCDLDPVRFEFPQMPATPKSRARPEWSGLRVGNGGFAGPKKPPV